MNERSRKHIEVAHVKGQIVDALLNAVRLRKLSVYVDDKGIVIKPCFEDCEKQAKYFHDEAMRRSEYLLTLLTLTDDDYERRNS